MQFAQCKAVKCIYFYSIYNIHTPHRCGKHSYNNTVRIKNRYKGCTAPKRVLNHTLNIPIAYNYTPYWKLLSFELTPLTRVITLSFKHHRWNLLFIFSIYFICLLKWNGVTQTKDTTLLTPFMHTFPRFKLKKCFPKMFVTALSERPSPYEGL